MSARYAPAARSSTRLSDRLQFSAKMWKTLSTSIFPELAQKYPNKVRFLFRQQIQPWHPSSTLVHEAAAAVLQVDPSKFVEFSSALFDHQKEYFDVNVVNEPRNGTYGRLAELAGSIGVDKSKILSLLQVPDKPAEDGSLNVGNGVTNDMKLMVKVHKKSHLHKQANACQGEPTDRRPCDADCFVQCKWAIPGTLARH